MFAGHVGLFFATFQAVATLLGIAAIGFWLVKRGTLGEQVLAPISTLAIDVALPCLIFANIMTSFHPATTPWWWLLPLAWGVFTVGAFVLSLLGGRLTPRRTRGEFQTCLFFQNGIFLPLNILVQLFGPESPRLVELFLFTLFYPAFFFTAGALFFGQGLQFNRQRVFNPVLIITVLALIIKLAGLDHYIPAFAISALKQVGATSIPLLMIIIGGSIYLDFRQQGPILVWDVLRFILVKNLLFPLVALGILILLRPPPAIALIVMIQAAMPPVTALPVFAERYGGDRALVNQFIVASFVAALLSVPVMVMLFSRWFPG